MKPVSRISTVRRAATGILVGFLLGAGPGCSSRDAIDVRLAEHAFQTASADDQRALQEVLASLRADQLTQATAQLEKLTNHVELTPAQRESLRDLLLQLRARLAPPTNQTRPR